MLFQLHRVKSQMSWTNYHKWGCYKDLEGGSPGLFHGNVRHSLECVYL
jgi:hypothetical protein